MIDPEQLVAREYLVGHGTAGDFGRFRTGAALDCRRGDRVVVQTHRGLELGTVLCDARPGHAQFLPNSSVGRLLRRATAEDEATAREREARGREFFEDSRRRVAELGLPLEVLDAELLLDGRQAILHYLRWAECDERPLVSSLCKEYGFFVALHNLQMPAEAPEEHAGCGAENCGQGDCGSHGGCSTCGIADLVKHAKPGHRRPDPVSR